MKDLEDLGDIGTAKKNEDKQKGILDLEKDFGSFDNEKDKKN